MSILEITFSIIALTNFHPKSSVWEKLDLDEEVKTFVSGMARDRSVESK